MTTPLGTAALALAARGLRVLPCWERSKNPITDHGLKEATSNQHKIAGWWCKRDFNVAIATGPGSGIWVLDVDGDEGEATLRRLEAEHGALPPTIEAITGKGRHLYFRWPAGTEIRNSQVRDDIPGLDVRGDGGYVLAPPSIHPSGRAYCWSVDSANEFADAPDWLIDLVTRKGGSDAPPATPPERWRSFIDDTYEGSHRGHAVARLAGLLLRRYIDPFVALSLCQIFNMHRCAEPLTWNEVARIVNDIARRELARRDREEAERETA
jgi:hypothetical protein